MNDLNEVIGKNLKLLRRLKKSSQEVLAEHLGIHQTALSRVENGKQSLTPIQLKRASEFFEMPIDWIFIDVDSLT